MAPASFFTGGPTGEQRNEQRKSPVLTGGAQKIFVRANQRTANILGSPAKGGQNKRFAHGAMENAHDELLIAARANSISSRAGFSGPDSRRDGSRLWSISQIAEMPAPLFRTCAAMGQAARMLPRNASTSRCRASDYRLVASTCSFARTG
jgi:hypothetical protein